jgi:hypothetical protein
MVPSWFLWVMYLLVGGTCSLLIWDEVIAVVEWVRRERELPIWERIESTFDAVEVLSFGFVFGFGVLCLEFHRYAAAIYFFWGGCTLLSIRMIAIVHKSLSGITQWLFALLVCGGAIFTTSYLMGITLDAQREYLAEVDEKGDEQLRRFIAEHTQKHPPTPPRPSLPRTYLIFEDKEAFPFTPTRDFVVGDQLAFNVFTRNIGPNELQGVVYYLWLYVEDNFAYPTQDKVLANFKRKIREPGIPPAPRSLEIGDRHFITAWAWDENKQQIQLSQSLLDALHAGTKICFVVVQVNYKDNGVQHHLRRCAYLQPPATRPGIWHFCKDFASD